MNKNSKEFTIVAAEVAAEAAAAAFKSASSAAHK